VLHARSVERTELPTHSALAPEPWPLTTRRYFLASQRRLAWPPQTDSLSSRGVLRHSAGASLVCHVPHVVVALVQHVKTKATGAGTR
jgi:hypothetical protein